MNIDAAEWERMLGQTLHDGKLTSSERQALKARLADGALDERTRLLLRSAAYDLAKRRISEGGRTEVVEWLDEVAKLLLPFGGEHADPFVEAHFSPGEVCAKRIVGLLDGCRKSADVCVFTITDDRIASALLAAHRRKVAVRIVSDNEKALDEGSDVLMLARSGLSVKIDDSPYHMHHKFALFDGDVLLTGSYNWTRGAAMNNQENLILSNDRRLVSAFRGEFERLWGKFGPVRA